jgi:hypothetical protein
MVKHRHIVPNDLEWEGNTFNEYKPITNIAWVRAQLSNLRKGCTRLAAASDKVYQLLAQCRWFSPVPPPLQLVAMIQSSKLDFRIYWPENFKIIIFI